LLAGIIGAILWCFGQRGFVIGVLGAIVIIGVIIMVVGLVIDQTATGGTGATGAVIVFLP
jgi:hypothetical protein